MYLDGVHIWMCRACSLQGLVACQNIAEVLGGRSEALGFVGILEEQGLLRFAIFGAALISGFRDKKGPGKG